jgi:hypothetical protein
MGRWAAHARDTGLRFCFFMSVEDIVALAASDPDGYEAFIGACRELAESGTVFHPHNHRVFDPATGVPLTPSVGVPKWVDGYANQASMFYDAHHRHGVDLTEWVAQVDRSFSTFLDDVGHRPPRKVFRAGGFDCGSTPEEQAIFLEALVANGYDVDSSATLVEGSTRGTRVAVPFGRNCHRLEGGLVEVAPSWALDCGADVASLPVAGAVVRLAAQHQVWLRRKTFGAFAVLLHFDHLFHERDGRLYALFSMTDHRQVERRIDRALSLVARITDGLNLPSGHFADVVTDH